MKGANHGRCLVWGKQDKKEGKKEKVVRVRTCATHSFESVSLRRDVTRGGMRRVYIWSIISDEHATIKRKKTYHRKE